MRITGCEILHCNAGWRDFSFLKLTTDDGITGIAEYNECYGSPGLSTIIRRLVDKAKGMDAMAHERVHQYLYAVTRQAPGGVNQQAIATIENALLDIKGQALGVPVYDLLGGKMRDEIPVYWSHCGTYLMNPEVAAMCGQEPIQSPEDLVKLGLRVRESGIKGLKTNMILFDDEGVIQRHFPGFAAGPGWPDLNVPAGLVDGLRDQLIAMAEGAGHDMGIRLDLNFNFKPEGYRQICMGLDDLGLSWIEIDLYDPVGLAAIRERVATPIASCESLFGLREFRPFFEKGSMDVAIIDVPWNGAWLGMKIAAMAEAFEINCAPHNFYGHLSTLMSAHFCTALPNFRVMEIDIDDVPWKDDIITWKPTIIDGNVQAPPGPGWGAKLNEDVIAAHPPKFVTVD
ncbi:MAG: mandelate racemase/muconate lactonizing enzyme family protein [Alphaproteobacteria bacterium]|jgi:galactonate dehydratase